MNVYNWELRLCGSEEMWEEEMLEKADIAANEAQKLLVVFVGINY